MNVEHDSNCCLKRLIYNGKNLVCTPWGAEVGNWTSFWSQEKESQNMSCCAITSNSLVNEFYIPKFSLKVVQREQWSEDTLERTYSFFVTSHVFLGDVVNRLTFSAHSLTTAVVNGRSHLFEGKDRRYIARENSVRLKNDVEVKIRAQYAVCERLSASFFPQLYVRDECNGAWAVHARWIAKYPGDKYICRTRPFNIKVPAVFFGKKQFLAREFDSRKFVNCGSVVWCEEGDWFRISLKVRVI